jgi:hypothetical protein
MKNGTTFAIVVFAASMFAAFAAAASLQHAGGISKDKTMPCRYQLSLIYRKCSQNIPFILPFP